MTLGLKDPLLAVARAIVIIAQAVMAIAAAALVIGLPLVFFLRERIALEIRAELADPAVQFPLFATLGFMLLALATVVLSWLFLRNLRRIIDTVGDGDPFVPANAERLTGMAWLMLAIQLLAIPLGGLAVFIATSLKEPLVEVDINLDFSGVILVVTLFILARVFRVGAAMRDDLEGTV